MTDSLDGEYYLHTNGNLIFKPNGGVDSDSDSVRAKWLLSEITIGPRSFLEWLHEVYTLGAKVKEIRRVAQASGLPELYRNWEDEVITREGVKDHACLHGVSVDDDCEHCRQHIPF